MTPQDRLKRVFDYIEQNLDEPLTIDTLCQVAYWSKYHFHRLCTAYFGIGVHQLIKLLRMKRAAFQLAYRQEMNIIDIALSNGYDSHQAFSRSFNQLFGLTPTAFRQTPSWHSWQQHYDHVIQLRIKTMTDTTHYSIDIVDFPETPLAVLEHKGAPARLGHSIQRFIAWRKKIGLPPSKSRTFNLIYDDPRVVNAEDYRFDLACAYDSPNLGSDNEILRKVIPAGKCVRYRHIGSDDMLSHPIDYLYSDWLESSGRDLRDFPLFLERVSFFPEVSEYEMITDIYLPII